MQYQFVGRHQEDLADGTPLEYGERYDMSKEDLEDNHNAALVADQKLIPVSSKGQQQAAKVAEEVKDDDNSGN